MYAGGSPMQEAKAEYDCINQKYPVMKSEEWSKDHFSGMMLGILK